jgi:hypothetical protein
MPIKHFSNSLLNFAINKTWQFKVNLYNLKFLHLDAVKPSTCFFSSFFLVRYLWEARSSPNAIDGYNEDFCSSY